MCYYISSAIHLWVIHEIMEENSKNNVPWIRYLVVEMLVI